MSDAVASLADLAVKPISDSAPAGESARYDPSYEELRREIDKLSGVGVDTLDWKKVTSLSTQILESKSKDLLIASYLCRAVFQTGGYTSLPDALEMVHRLMATHWDGLFPDRTKGRLAAVSWLSEKLSSAVEKRSPSPGDKAALDASVEKIRQIESLLEEKLGGEAPSLRVFIAALEEVAVEEPPAGAPAAAPSAPQAPGAAAAPAAPSAPPPTTTAEDLSTPEGVERAIKSSLAALRNATRRIRASSPQDPLPYKVSRLAAWGRAVLPPPGPGGNTRVPPPGGNVSPVERLGGLAAQGQWPVLLQEAESQFEQTPLWLDTQRLVFQAMQNMGDDYQAAMAVVRTELLALLQRLQGLQELNFSDGTPFASPETRTWISEEVQAEGASQGGGAPSAPAAPSRAETDEDLVQALNEARAMGGKRQLKQAVASVWSVVETAGAAQTRFRRRLGVARFLTERKEFRLAVSLLASLDREIAAFRLEEWDPDLALECLRLHLTCQRALVRSEWKSSPEALRQAEDLYTRVARLDPRAALDMGAK